jgi:hypothetical protein
LVKLCVELSPLILEIAVSIYFRNCCQVVETLGLLDKGVETSIMTGEEGEESWSYHFRGGVSIVRAEKEFCDVGGFPRLPPGQ